MICFSVHLSLPQNLSTSHLLVCVLPASDRPSTSTIRPIVVPIAFLVGAVQALTISPPNVTLAARDEAMDKRQQGGVSPASHT